MSNEQVTELASADVEEIENLHTEESCPSPEIIQDHRFGLSSLNDEFRPATVTDHASPYWPYNLNDCQTNMGIPHDIGMPFDRLRYPLHPTLDPLPDKMEYVGIM